MAWAQISALILLLGGSSFINLSSASSCRQSIGDGHSHSHSHSHSHAHDQNSHGNGHIHDHEHQHNLDLAHGSYHSHDDHDTHGHHHHDVDHHHHCHHHDHRHESNSAKTGHFKLAEELAEEEELRLYGFDPQSHPEESHHHHHHHHHDHKISEKSSVLGLWLPALGCSLLVSTASLICLILLPFIVAQGRPSRIVVDFLAAFGAGAMLGDAFLHQLPHALGGSHAHDVEHNHHEHGHSHHDDGAQGHGHAHSIQDLSVGLAVLAGIILFFIVEKIVRQVEESSSKGALTWGHHHHHHRHHEDDHNDEHRGDGENQGQKNVPDKETLKEKANDSTQEKTNAHEPRRRKNARKDSIKETTPLLSDKDESEKKSAVKPIEKIDPPNHILGYLNLFSDGVHNFTDGMALGSAFLNHGTIGGWSRTLFLLAHEIPQEVGDFGVLLQSGFTVFKALAFNFLSALVALAGTALALLWGGSPENSSLIEGFTAGGFIYIAIAGVLPEMHRTGTSAKTTFLQLVALGSGMSIALVISLIE